MNRVQDSRGDRLRADRQSRCRSRRLGRPRVTVYSQPSAWSEYLVAEAQFVVPVPDDLSDDVAPQMLVNPLAVSMLRREAEATRAIGYNGVFLQTAAGSSIGRLTTAEAVHHRMALINSGPYGREPARGAAWPGPENSMNRG